MPIKLITYLCKYCNEEFDTHSEAAACESEGLEEQVANVGDIVFLHAGFRWFDGDGRWVSNLSVLDLPRYEMCKHNCFGDCCTLKFYYVVTAIDQDPKRGHKLRYHCFTKAMTGQQGHRGGWTHSATHHTPKVVKKPPAFVVKDSIDLLGKKSNGLL